MSDTVAAYWRAREQTPEEAAKQLAALLDVLRSTHPSAASWFKLGRPVPDRDDAIDTSVVGLTHLFAQGVNRRDTDHSIITDLGYRVNFWNGNNDDAAGVSVKAGATSTVPGITNSVVLDFPSTPAWRADAEQLFTQLVEIFEPDRALWMTREYRRSQPTIDGATMFGWLTYLTGALASRVTSTPDGVIRRDVANGTVFIAGTEPGPESCALAAALAEQLLR
ncbi:MAG: hypothetical protein JWO76_1852 [Nocardioides sp.]|nr:hypothetical protein [Nocardioides sp.]